MTVKLLMDWPDSRDGKRYVAGNLLTTDAGTEAGMIAAKMASSSVAGGTAYVAPAVKNRRDNAECETDSVSGEIRLCAGSFSISIERLAAITPADRAVARYKIKRAALPGLPNLFAIGDAYCVGAGASSIANGFQAKIEADVAGRVWGTNYGAANYPISRYTSAAKISGAGSPSLNQAQIFQSDITCCLIGQSDLRGAGHLSWADASGCGPDPDHYSTLRARVQAMALWAIVPEAAKVRALSRMYDAENPAITFTGGVRGKGMPGMPSALSANTPWSLSFSVPAGDLLILWLPRSTAGTASWAVTVDGTPYPPVSTIAQYDTWAQDCVIYKLPTSTTHNVVLSSSAAGATTAFEGAACVDTSKDWGATFVYATPIYLNDGAGIGWGLKDISMNSASVNTATGANAWLYGNGAADRFGAAIDDAMQELYDYGANVIKVDPRNGWNKDAMLAADTINPNDAGHAFIANKFRNVMRRLLVA